MKAATKRPPDLDHGGLVPPAEMFGRVLHGRPIVDAHLPFGERVEREWKRPSAGFEEDEHERLRRRERLVEVIEGDRRKANDREPY